MVHTGPAPAVVDVKEEYPHPCSRCGTPNTVRDPVGRCWKCIDSERNYLERKLRRSR